MSTENKTMQFLLFSSLLVLGAVHSSTGELIQLEKETILCHQCSTGPGVKNCLQDAQYLHPCPQGTKMCYIVRKSNGVYLRGCLTKGTIVYKACHEERSNNCFVCYGTGCNHVDIVSKKRTLQFCMRCKSDRECQLKMDPEQCDGHDSIFGPKGCFTQYTPDGKSIVKKDCLNKMTGKYDKGIVTCIGHVCNYPKADFQTRCLKFHGHPDHVISLGKITDCYKEIPSRSVMSGCYYKIQRQTIIYGCNTMMTPEELNRCSIPRICQMCQGDLCNNRTVEFINQCMVTRSDSAICMESESMCFVEQQTEETVWGCLTVLTPGLYHPDTLACSNEKEGHLNCAPTENVNDYRGCYECSGPRCEDVLGSLSYTAKTVCPLGITQCYSALRLDGRIFRGCYTNNTSEGVKICRDSIGACKICNHNYCNYDPLVPAKGQCYKTNWNKNHLHETSLRFADCQGEYFYGTTDNCYIAASSRLLMRMGCISEMRAGVDASYAITTGTTHVAWLYQNTCYKCVSNAEGFCLDVQLLKPHTCKGLHRYPVRGCFTMIDKRNRILERGCVTEVNEYLLRLCDMPIFVEKCQICQDNGCNNEFFETV